MTTGPISREDDMNNIAILLLSDMTDNSTIGTVDLSFAHPLSIPISKSILTTL